VRTYRIEDLAPEHVQRLARALDARGLGSGMEGLYWLPLPPDLLGAEQMEHAPECGPHVLSLELLDEGLSLELLVRARGRLRCSCVAYATPAQRAWGMDTVDALLRELDIPS
jgi:hypothetical protein